MATPAELEARIKWGKTMKRAYVFVEGQTDADFLQKVLVPEVQTDVDFIVSSYPADPGIDRILAKPSSSENPDPASLTE